MARIKGSPKTGGRVAGSVNKDIKPLREFLTKLIEDYTVEDFKNDLAQAEPVERAKLYASLFEFVVPKLTRTELTGNDGEALIPASITVVSEQTKIDINNL
jgi:hypothetical protein